MAVLVLWAGGLGWGVFGEEREWRDVNGRVIRATLKRVEGDRVVMEKEGRDYLFPLAVLSEADRARVRAWATGRAEASRSSEGLLVLYDFAAAEGNVVKDRSGVAPALDLRIGEPGNVKRSAGKLEVARGRAGVASREAARKVIERVKRSGELTVETWAKSNDLRQDGPARLVTISRDTSNRNFTLGQDGDRFNVRLRSTKTSRNGLPALESPKGSVSLRLAHLVYARERGGRARFYLNGKQVAEKKVDGDLRNWDANYRLSLGDEMTGDRGWRGELHWVALYDRALSAEEVKRHFGAGAGASTPFGNSPSVATTEPETPGAPALRGESNRLFETKVAPLLAKHCLECHDSATNKGKLDLSWKKTALAGGADGPSIVPGKPEESLLWEVVESDDMPKKRPPLTAEEKATLRDWLKAGAPWTLDYLDAATYVHASHGGERFARRLTLAEYVATVKAVTGVEVSGEAARLLPPDLRADGFSNTAYNLKVDLKHVEAYAKLAELVVSRMNPEAFAKRFHGRLSLNKEMRAVIEKMGAWVLRGPLDEEEVAAFRGVTTSVASSGGSLKEALGAALRAMLQSPRFLYRLEKPGRRGGGEVGPYEMASRMSYLLWGAPPDEELYRAAERNRLSSDAEIADQARRMLADERAVEQSLRFAHDWLDLGRLDHLNPDKKRFPRWNPALGADMRAETLAFFREVVWTRKRPLAELLNAQVTFLTPRLATHYGVPAEEENFARYDLREVPARGGLLTQGSVLTVGGDEASMVARGLFVLHELLRGVVRDPPPCVDVSPVPTKPGLTQRGISAARLAKASCNGCHVKFEPLAFGLEKFDGLGAFHPSDHHGNALREDGEILFPGRSGPLAYRTSAELMNHLAASPRVAESLTWKVVQFALGRPLGAEDARQVVAIHQAAQKAGGTYQSLVTAILLSDLVRKHANVETP